MLVLPDLNTYNVNTVFGCTNITRADVGTLSLLTEAKTSFEEDKAFDEVWDIGDNLYGYRVENLTSNLQDVYILGDITGQTENLKITLPINSDYLFSNFVNMTSVVGLNNLNTSQMDRSYRLFENDFSLTELDLSNWNLTSHIFQQYWANSIGYGCNNLTKINLSNWNFISETYYRSASLPSISSMFPNSGKVEEIDASNWNWKDPNFSAQGFLSGLRNLRSYNLNNWNWSGAISFPSFFQNCRSLEYIDMQEFLNTPPLARENLAYFFCNCYSLKEIDNLGNFVGEVSSLEDTFYGCSQLNSLNLINIRFSEEDGLSLRGVFDGCRNLKGIETTPNWNINLMQYNGLQNAFCFCSQLTEIPSIKINVLSNIKVTGTVYTASLSNTFERCQNLTSINLEIESIYPNISNGGIDLSSMFSNCYNLRSIGGFDSITKNSSQITEADYLFSNCTNLSDVSLSNFILTNISLYDTYRSIKRNFL